MIGLGVGIDYALFIVTRYRENLKRGASVEDSVAESIDTSGRAVLFAGIDRDHRAARPVADGPGVRAGRRHRLGARRAAMMIAASLTLLPALLGWVGARIDNTTWAALIAVGFAWSARSSVSPPGQRGIFLGGFVLAILFFAAQLRRQAAAPPRPAPPGEAEGTAALVPLESLHPAPARAGRSSSPSAPAAARRPAVLDPSGIRRLPATLQRGPDGAQGLRHARRGFRARHQRPAVRHRAGRHRRPIPKRSRPSPTRATAGRRRRVQPAEPRLRPTTSRSSSSTRRRRRRTRPRPTSSTTCATT